MTKERQDQEIIELIAESTLSVFSEISSIARSQLEQIRPSGPDTLASVNTLTDNEAVKSLESISAKGRNDRQVMAREPAIARVVAKRDDGEKVTYFFCRAIPVKISCENGNLAGYLSPVGRLASLPIGSEFELKKPGGIEYLEVLERAELHPALIGDDWDSVDSKLQGQGYGSLTVGSFRGLLKGHDEGATLLDSLLAEEEASSNVTDGIRRSVISKMGLRDQPILDQYQDAIFRRPLDSQLLILGPPGSGKTTTLIRRLGQKLDKDFLEPEEREIVDRAQPSSALEHENSWVMFTPTELLKQYLKEAFAREGIAASDQRIITWSDYRRELARNRFAVLRTASGGGSFIMKDTLNSLQDNTLARQIEWFEDFQAWQTAAFWEGLNESARSLSNNTETPVAALGAQLSTIVEGAAVDPIATVFVTIAAVADKVQALISSKKSDSDGRIKRALNLQVNRDRNFLDDLARLIDGLTDLDEDPDDQELEGDEEAVHAQTGRAAAVAAYSNTIRAQARAQVAGRVLGRESRSGRIAGWIGERSLEASELRTIGESLQVQVATRKFLNPIRSYLGGIPSRYRRFRRIRRSEDKWYRPNSAAPAEVGPLEVDVILLSILRAAGELLLDRRILQNIEDQNYSSLREILRLTRNQVMVDEATDFSPIQIACMGAISNPQIRSFFACGDFNQRITEWGSRSASEMEWAFPDIDVRSIVVTYRHSKQLVQLAKEIVRLCKGDASNAVLPENVDSEGVQPVLAKGLVSRDKIVDWLAHRVVEIEQFTAALPSVAVLVNNEEDVGPISDALNEALANQNIRVVPCYNGQVVGQENDIRVFDVQHIKGLEFEAVFFIGIDVLSEMNPTLFDKYLYVGITRAATYLGLTCVGDSLPSKIAALEPHFISSWSG